MKSLRSFAPALSLAALTSLLALALAGLTGCIAESVESPDQASDVGAVRASDDATSTEGRATDDERRGDVATTAAALARARTDDESAGPDKPPPFPWLQGGSRFIRAGSSSSSTESEPAPPEGESAGQPSNPSGR